MTGGLPFIRTARLWLLPFTEDDIDVLHAIWVEPDVRRYLWHDVVIARERAADVVREAIATADECGIGYWTVRTEQGGPVVGNCGFHFMECRTAIELFYSLAKSHWGKGLAFEASHAALSYAWRATRFDRVYAHIDAPNEASLRLARRLGFEYVSNAGGMETYAISRPATPIGGPS
jgi:ribosomal-protein-alanine N-acetyltransferase